MEAREKIKNTLWQVKGQQYYCEELIKELDFSERCYQAFIVFATVLGMILLFVMPEGICKIIILILTLLAQISTIVYPYVMNYSSDMMQLKQYVILLKSLSNDIYLNLAYSEINEQDIIKFEAEYQRIDELVDIRSASKKKNDKLIGEAQRKTKLWMKEKIERIKA